MILFVLLFVQITDNLMADRMGISKV